MPKILIVYGTTHRQTAKIAAAVADTLRAQGATADVHDAGVTRPQPEPYDAVIVAASVHAGHYQRPLTHWVQSHRAALNSKPTAFVSVCLGVLQQDAKVQQELAAIVDRFMATTCWQPTITKHVAGALLYTKYNWLIRRVMKRIAGKAGGDTDTTRDHEYTDWADVREFAVQFARMVERGDAARPASKEAPTAVAV